MRRWVKRSITAMLERRCGVTTVRDEAAALAERHRQQQLIRQVLAHGRHRR